MFAFGTRTNTPERFLSGAYNNMHKWVLVYHTGHGNEVELITDRFFATKEKALKWFKRKSKIANWIRPEVIKVSGFNLLHLSAETAQDVPEDL